MQKSSRLPFPFFRDDKRSTCSPDRYLRSNSKSRNSHPHTSVNASALNSKGSPQLISTPSNFRHIIHLGPQNTTSTLLDLGPSGPSQSSLTELTDLMGRGKTSTSDKSGTKDSHLKFNGTNDTSKDSSNKLLDNLKDLNNNNNIKTNTVRGNSVSSICTTNTTNSSSSNSSNEFFSKQLNGLPSDSNEKSVESKQQKVSL